MEKYKKTTSFSGPNSKSNNNNFYQNFVHIPHFSEIKKEKLRIKILKKFAIEKKKVLSKQFDMFIKAYILENMLNNTYTFDKSYLQNRLNGIIVNNYSENNKKNLILLII